ncbi:MAG: hypothetical protein IJ391_06435 [Clostridia bacterium]|nr:hypothetical protein [Clostridia bacterium]
MKKHIKQKSLVIISIIVLIANIIAVLSTQAAIVPPADVVAPQNIAIAFTGNDLSLGTLGKLYCYGETQADPIYYDVGVLVELQQYDGGWNTIKSWVDIGNGWAIVSEYYYVEPGYSYRLKLTHYAYDIDTGDVVEKIEDYSVGVRYTTGSN